MNSPKEYDFNPDNLPRSVLAAIGLAVAAAAQTESIVEDAIAGCSGMDIEYGHAVTTHMTAPLRDHVLRSVAEIKIDDLDALDELDRILDHIKNDALPKRNAIVHSVWGRDPETGGVVRTRFVARGSLTAELLPMTVDEIKSDAHLIANAGLLLMNFLQTHGLLATLPTAPRPRYHKSRTARKKRRNK